MKLTINYYYAEALDYLSAKSLNARQRKDGGTKAINRSEDVLMLWQIAASARFCGLLLICSNHFLSHYHCDKLFRKGILLSISSVKHSHKATNLFVGFLVVAIIAMAQYSVNRSTNIQT